jgi:hypothetical protein
MEAATLFTLGANAGIQVACLLAVSDNLNPDIQPQSYDQASDANEKVDTDIQPKSYNPDRAGERIRIDDCGLTQAAETMGSIALAALSA